MMLYLKNPDGNPLNESRETMKKKIGDQQVSLRADHLKTPSEHFRCSSLST